jgi:FKBP-type peptidyl-prolyl cis-trans isomerase
MMTIIGSTINMITTTSTTTNHNNNNNNNNNNDKVFKTTTTIKKKRKKNTTCDVKTQSNTTNTNTDNTKNIIIRGNRDSKNSAGRRAFLITTTIATIVECNNNNNNNNASQAKGVRNTDDDDDFLVNPNRIKVENAPEQYKPNEYWTEATKEQNQTRTTKEEKEEEQKRDPKEVFKTTNDREEREGDNVDESNNNSNISNRKQQEVGRTREDADDDIIEISIDLVEPGYVPSSQKEADDKTLKQAVNNAKIKQFNNAPDDFPTFIREGYEVNVVVPDGYKKTEDGLMFYDFAKGKGSSPGKDQEVTFHYVAYNENGGVIDSTYRKNTPAKARLGIKGMIPGFEEGLSTMKPGGKRRIVVPPELGPPIGPATFFSSKQWEVFDIELLDSKSCSREGGLPGGFGSSIVCV